MKITEQIAARLLSLVDRGLTFGLGKPRPGEMCIQAAVNYAMNAGHNDSPECVDAGLRSEGIGLNDSRIWANKADRAEGLRQFAIAQLGTAGKQFDFTDFMERVGAEARRLNPSCFPGSYAGDVVVGLARSIHRNRPDKSVKSSRPALGQAVDIAVKVLTDMKTEGSQYVCLTKLPKKDVAKVAGKIERSL